MELHRKLDEQEMLEFRQWARDNYVPEDERNVIWHPVVLSEMEDMDKESEGCHNDWVHSLYAGKHCPKCDSNYVVLGSKVSQVNFDLCTQRDIEIIGELNQRVYIDKLWCPDCLEEVYIRPKIRLVDFEDDCGEDM